MKVQAETEMNLSTKFAICVGATSGIGRAIAVNLAGKGVSIAIVARNPTLGGELISELQTINPTGNYTFYKCDCAYLKEIAKTCAELSSKISKANYLVLCQGKITTDAGSETSEGMKRIAALQIYGSIFFIKQLETLLRRTAASEEVRVLNVLTGGNRKSYPHMDDLDNKKHSSIGQMMDCGNIITDLALDQIAHDFAAVDQKVSFIHTFPGSVGTNYADEMPCIGTVFRIANFFSLMMKPEDCAKVMVDAGLLGEAMAPPRNTSTTPVKATFRTMNEHGASSKICEDHTEANRAIVWAHVLEKFERALASA